MNAQPIDADAGLDSPATAFGLRHPLDEYRCEAAVELMGLELPAQLESAREVACAYIAKLSDSHGGSYIPPYPYLDDDWSEPAISLDWPLGGVLTRVRFYGTECNAYASQFRRTSSDGTCVVEWAETAPGVLRLVDWPAANFAR